MSCMFRYARYTKVCGILEITTGPVSHVSVTALEFTVVAIKSIDCFCSQLSEILPEMGIISVGFCV